MVKTPELLLANARCGQCLTTKNRIVEGKRAAQIIRDCRAEGNHFVCHKSPEGVVIHCRGVHDLLVEKHGGSRAYRLATAIGIPITEVDPEDVA